MASITMRRQDQNMQKKHFLAAIYEAVVYIQELKHCSAGCKED